jgi:prophage maintenance system killer protein
VGLFLALNGFSLEVTQLEATKTMLALAIREKTKQYQWG